MNIIEKNLTEIINSYTNQKKIHLLVAYYNDKNLDRQGEIDFALRLNIKNKIFEKIIIVNDNTDLSPLVDPRVIIVPTYKRPTFRNFFDLANFYSDEDTVNILVNSDIILGEGLGKITEMEKDQAICLTRHDILEDGTYSQTVGGGSHDCWIWKGRMTGDPTPGNFYMGQWHCDGVLAAELYDNGYILKNPIYNGVEDLGIRAYHLHLTNIRNYSIDVKIKGLRKGVSFSENNGIFNKDDTYYDGYTG